MPNKILIANRGEIALRVIRACKELGIGCVAVYARGDEDSLHVKFADEAVCVGPANAAESYLNMNNIISAAVASGCNAIHPGYGFLAENDRFATIVERCNLKFIGPSGAVMARLGNKSEARRLAKELGIPTVEGSDGPVENVATAAGIAARIGYPVLIKAVSGGGGKGISIINNTEELYRLFELTRHEAEVNFGDSQVYIEKYIENPRHIEVQIIADSFGNTVHLGERDRSVQRRNQKIIEEAPSPFVGEELRARLGEAAVRLARAVGYQNAGTIEFIVDEKGNYYFIEVNTRIQVEHPVTEAVTGIDLVKEQIRVAYKDELSFRQEDVRITGHALECRLNAEDPNQNFRPSPGLIRNLVLPGGSGVRLDTHIYNNYEVPPHYDSLLAKVITHAPTRKEAIRKMRVALEQMIIDGVKTNIELLYLIMHNTNFVRGVYDTGFLRNFMETIKGE
ncbi:MAG TPA: acetyl-CoA carboxylase biotin carboxylase subunit [Acholeplasmataceae bacterium]|nr:acetyl-CoA carboxylase biotin carboxylase subunit [Acholeplasmataceae bacterium]